MLGTLINVGTVVLGSGIGLLLKSRFPERVNTIVFQAIGLFTIALGLRMALNSSYLLVMILSLISGSIIGEILNIDTYVKHLSELLKKRVKSKDTHFTEALITAFILFCLGSLTIMGAIEEGMKGSSEIYITKAVMDGFSAIALAAALGRGVLFSALPLFILQAGLTLFFSIFKTSIDPQYITELLAVGGIILMGLGLNLIGLLKIKVVNFIPALFISLVFTWLYEWFTLSFPGIL